MLINLSFIRKFVVSVIILLVCNFTLYSRQVHIGAEVLLDKHLDLLYGKRIGIICNHTSVLPNGVHLVDTLLHRGINVTTLYAPEHGIRGNKPAGEKIDNEIDEKTGLKVYSLYGGTRSPTIEMLLDVDVLIFDMQDAGARFYTYASTMGYCMRSAADNGKKFIVLDRPNPINGKDIEGPVLDLQLMSFIGLYPIPVRHGLTIGELARMIVDEGYINPSNVELTVIPMEGWKRSMWYNETGLPWISPSPNMKTVSTATVYPGTCLFEATNISEGRGTEKPFEYIGAPKLNNSRIVNLLNDLKLPGVKFSTIDFTPKGDSITGIHPKFENKKCNGIYVQVTDREKFKPVITGVMMISVMKDVYPKKFILKKGLFDRLIGDELISEKMENRKVDKNLFSLFNQQTEQFLKIRSKFLLYK